jgi:hypothetical protein
MGLENLGFGDKSKYETNKVNMFDRLDDAQSTATPHIYWGGRTCPARKSLNKSNSIRIP